MSDGQRGDRDEPVNGDDEQGQCPSTSQTRAGRHEDRAQLRGRKLGDRRVRVERPQAEFFRYAAKDTLVARPKAHVEKRPLGRAYAVGRRLLFGRPLASEEEADERLPKKKALAIFSSDAISSSAYATEEILRALLLAGASAGVGYGYLGLALPVSIGLAILLGVVALSYRMIVVAYPTGGGSYSVSKATFGRMPSLVAASALLVGYVLTVAVSVSSAADQIDLGRPRRWRRTTRSSRSARCCSSPSPTCEACARPATSSPSLPTCSWAWPC